MSGPSKSELQLLLRAGTPLALASLVQTLVGTIAVAVAGRLGEGTLGAVGLGSAVYFTVAVLGVGVLLGIDPIVTQAVGRGDTEHARRALAQGLVLALLLCLPLGVLATRVVAGLHGIDLAPETLGSVHAYVWGRLPGLAPFLGFVVLRSSLAAEGRTGHVLTAAVAANLCVLASAPGLAEAHGPLGIGWAESLGAWVQAVVLLGCVRPRGLLRLVGRLELIVPMLRVGVPVGLALVLEYAVFAGVNLQVALLEPAALGVHQVAITWVGTLFMLPVGFGGAAAARVGQALGRGDVASARRAGVAALAIAVGFGAVAALPFLTIPRLLASWVTSDPHAISLALPLMGVAALALVADSAQAVLAGAVRGAGDTRFALLASLLGHYGLGLPVGFVLATRGGLGTTGLWLGLSVGLGSVALLLALRFIVVIAPLGRRAERCEPRSRESSLPAPWPGPECSPHPSLGPETSRLHP